MMPVMRRGPPLRFLPLAALCAVGLLCFFSPAGAAADPVAAWLAAWPAARSGDPRPVIDAGRTRGAYASPAGNAVAERINRWYAEGSAAGLSAYAFRSFDGGHSNLRGDPFPQLSVLQPLPGARRVGALYRPEQAVFAQRVTFGVRSEGMRGPAQYAPDRLESVIEYATRVSLWNHYRNTGRDVHPLLQAFYARNFLFVVPAVGTYWGRRDSFTFLSPFYLHSVGDSGTDRALLTPIIMAAAALPPALSRRILRGGFLVPTLSQLFRQHYAGGLRNPAAHAPAFALPDEAAEGQAGPVPLLSALVEGAHGLSHIPPVTRIDAPDARVHVHAEPAYPQPAYLRVTPHHVVAVLRPDESFEATLDLRASAADAGQAITAYHAELLSGPGELTPIPEQAGRYRLRVAWTAALPGGSLRTDVLALASDGTYDGAPAYVSIKHVQPSEAGPLGMRGPPAVSVTGGTTPASRR